MSDPLVAGVDIGSTTAKAVIISNGEITIWTSRSHGHRLCFGWNKSVRDGINLVCHILTCLQCDYPACYFACPLKDEALCIDSVTGARYIIPDKCEPGCKVCIEACLFGPPRINFDPERNIAVKCDLCKDMAEGPACIEFCPAICLEERV